MQLFEPVFDSIIHKLILHKGVSIQHLHTLVNEDISISLPNFYKIIGKLIDERIITKEHGKLFLHNRWMLGILDLADELKKTYFTEISNVSQLLEGQSIIHEATSIEALDRVWADWELSVNKLYGQQQASFVYHSHPYYALGMYETEIPFFSQVIKFSELCYLCGNTKFLDQYGSNLYKKAGAKEAVASDKVPFLKEGYCITVVGDFIFEVLYPPEISDYFKIFFESVTDIKNFNAELFHRIFEMKANCKLTLRRDAIQAESTRKIFLDTYKREKRKNMT